MELLQTADDINVLTSAMYQIVAEVIQRLPFEVQEDLRHDLESYGYDFILQHALTKDEVPYLMKCLKNKRQSLLKNRMRQLQRFKTIKDDPTFDPGLEIDVANNDGVLDKLYAAYHMLPYRKREICYFFILLICKGSTNPVQATADYILLERHAVQRSLSGWKDEYANQINPKMHQVRSIEHLRRLMYVDLRGKKPDFTGHPPEPKSE